MARNMQLHTLYPPFTGPIGMKIAAVPFVLVFMILF